MAKWSQSDQVRRTVLVTGLALMALSLPLAAQAQSQAAGPVLPETITRGPDGVTVRAVRLDAPLALDGELTEDIYERVRPATGFVQVEPNPGAQARDQTEIWIMFDDENVYVAARAWDSDMEIVTTEMRRDNLWSGNDIVGFSFDTFLDGRNSMSFNTNALGARHDGQTTNESQWNGDVNPIWDVATGRFDGGWTLEAVIPFKSLRYGPGREQTWGIQVVRPSRSINEISFLTELPPARGQGAIQLVSLAATLVGIEAPPSSRIVEVKPYLTSSATTDVPSSANDLSGDVGLDTKIGITDGLTADFTVNTDFAQVEADEQQINLTRFSLFFPEKREFFLENAGTFSFGGVSVSGFGGSGDAPILFYSRRIGLEGGGEVPLRAGGRVTGRVGRYSLGLINIQADEAEEGGVGRHQLLRRAVQARHPPPERRRCDGHGALGRQSRGWRQLRVWPGRHVRVLRQPDDQLVLGPYTERGAIGRRRELSGAARLQRGSLWRAARASGRGSELQSRGRLHASP